MGEGGELVNGGGRGGNLQGEEITDQRFTFILK